MITIIAAIGKNNALGKDNQLIWKLPEDLKRFKNLTVNKPIIMGRKTFESLPKVLPNRKHVVISNNPDFQVDHPDVVVVNSIEEAIDTAKAINDDFSIIGGGNIYEQTLSMADVLEITLVDDAPEADTFFPKINLDDYRLSRRTFFPKSDDNPYAYEFLTYEKLA